MRQLPLSISLRDDATFDNYLEAPADALAVDILRCLAPSAEYALLYLCGDAGSGRSHLLQAVCHQQPESVYLPVSQLLESSPAEVFDDLHHQPLVCLDDIDSIAGNGAWEEAVFHFLNRKMAVGGAVLVSARQQGKGIFKLPDLVSRLSQGLLLRLQSPDDEQRAQLFAWRGERRGIHIPEDVAAYVLRHFSRDSHQLQQLLERLDTRSLAQQRRITIPFVRDVIADEKLATDR